MGVYLFLLIIFPLLGVSCQKNKQPPPSPNVSSIQADLEQKNRDEYPKVEFNRFGWVKIKGYLFQVQLAITEEQLRYGLMFRKELAKDEGMFFIFKEEKPRAFWMKNVPIPLTVAFINRQGVIISIKEMVPFDESSTFSDGFAQYALEVKSGRLKELKIKVGDKIQWGEFR